VQDVVVIRGGGSRVGRARRGTAGEELVGVVRHVPGGIVVRAHQPGKPNEGGAGHDAGGDNATATRRITVAGAEVGGAADRGGGVGHPAAGGGEGAAIEGRRDVREGDVHVVLGPAGFDARISAHVPGGAADRTIVAHGNRAVGPDFHVAVDIGIAG